MLSVFNYNESEFSESSMDSYSNLTTSKNVTWINIDNIKDPVLLGKIADAFSIHHLVIDDIMHTSQRPKVENYDNYLYIVVRLYNEKIESEQVSLILGKNFLLTFQEKKGEVFEAVKEKIRSNKGRLRKMGADFLAYSILDSIVDNYFVLLEKIGEKITSIENELIANPSYSTMHRIQRLRKNLSHMRKYIWPMREVVNALDRESREKSQLVRKDTTVYLRDLYDHSIQVIDSIEGFRDLVSGMVDMYLSSISNKLNEVMKVLTIISTIFIPLTFITGIYGMNFDFMPELRHEFGYFGVLIFMTFVAFSMFLYFRNKKWI